MKIIGSSVLIAAITMTGGVDSIHPEGDIRRTKALKAAKTVASAEGQQPKANKVGTGTEATTNKKVSKAPKASKAVAAVDDAGGTKAAKLRSKAGDGKSGKSKSKTAAGGGEEGAKAAEIRSKASSGNSAQSKSDSKIGKAEEVPPASPVGTSESAPLARTPFAKTPSARTTKPAARPIGKHTLLVDAPPGIENPTASKPTTSEPTKPPMAPSGTFLPSVSLWPSADPIFPPSLGLDPSFSKTASEVTPAPTLVQAQETLPPTVDTPAPTRPAVALSTELSPAPTNPPATPFPTSLSLLPPMEPSKPASPFVKPYLRPSSGPTDALSRAPAPVQVQDLPLTIGS